MKNMMWIADGWLKAIWSADWNINKLMMEYVLKEIHIWQPYLLWLAGDCIWMHLGTLSNLDWYIVKRSIERAPQDRAPWLFLVRTLTLRPFPLQLVHAWQNSIRLNCLPRMLNTFKPRNVWDTWLTICELAVFGVNNHFVWLVSVKFKIVLYGPLGNMQEFMLNRLRIDRCNRCKCHPRI